MDGTGRVRKMIDIRTVEGVRLSQSAPVLTSLRVLDTLSYASGTRQQPTGC